MDDARILDQAVDSMRAESDDPVVLATADLLDVTISRWGYVSPAVREVAVGLAMIYLETTGDRAVAQG